MSQKFKNTFQNVGFNIMFWFSLYVWLIKGNIYAGNLAKFYILFCFCLNFLCLIASNYKDYKEKFKEHKRYNIPGMKFVFWTAPLIILIYYGYFGYSTFWIIGKLFYVIVLESFKSKSKVPEDLR